ncbi:hypothetical protein BCL69_10268 [Nitrosomonas communis]|uniref:Uncharacterized protein n=1 Tax=Nitrosomonas communis TaxID=44574 RepID=A0A5D3YG01_9PROT|nr:hypothetical protein BCL69_10268 [Nitrosomonas communis]
MSAVRPDPNGLQIPPGPDNSWSNVFCTDIAFGKGFFIDHTVGIGWCMSF